MTDLTKKKCVPCSEGADPLTEEEIKELLPRIHDEWKVVDNKQIERVFRFKDFQQALNFTNQVGAIAEEEGHHPVLITSWGRVLVRLYTHVIDGLHENDFIVAAKVDEIA
ncbi:MAG: 4a-hydroxytetrahydrobiopterin dehydratase [Tissierellia bacterium]|nr:4a-hydroxytetrahydrobiopterin dehydratase [Bacillota bacterium]NLK57680.1 4a-hydroxytetrahydrobiopterin dehydratase [Tissierellia bacterium]